MGSACCVAAKDTSPLPRRISSEFPSRNIRFSPAWNCRWDSQGRVADEVENPSSLYSQGSGNTGFGTKDSVDVECGDLSERQTQVDFQTSMVQKSPSHEDPCGNLTPASEASGEISSLNEVNGVMEPSAVASPLASASRLSFSIPSTPCTVSNEELSSQRGSHPNDSTPSWQVHHSPGYHPTRQVPDGRPSGMRSPNNSAYKGWEAFLSSIRSRDYNTAGSLGGGPSEGWSLPTSSELVASSQTERWSFDSENLDSARGKVTRSSSSFSVSPSVDLRTCGVCSKLLMERSPWVAQKIVVSNDLSVVAVLFCGHVYHAECLENTTPETYRFDPPCPVCTTGNKQGLKIYGKHVKIDTESKTRNRIPKNRVVDSNHEIDFNALWRSNRREGKGPMLGSSSSLKSSFTKPFLRRHFSLGSKSSKSILESEFSTKSPNRKGFWSKYRKG